MSTSLPPAGWYTNGDHGPTQWWDGRAWGMMAAEFDAAVERISASAEPAKTPTRIYWMNLLRFRTLWFLFAGPIVGGMLIYAVVPIPPIIIWAVLASAMAWVMLTTQMACHACGTQLRVTRLSGQQDVCHRCGHETDKSLAKRQIQI